MKKESLEDELLEDSHIFLQPERYRIMELHAEKPMHLDGISRALGVKRGLVAYPLSKQNMKILSLKKLNLPIKMQKSFGKTYFPSPLLRKKLRQSQVEKWDKIEVQCCQCCHASPIDKNKMVERRGI
jgi:hypothetical protein